MASLAQASGEKLMPVSITSIRLHKPSRSATRTKQKQRRAAGDSGIKEVYTDYKEMAEIQLRRDCYRYA